jgi:protease-4
MGSVAASGGYYVAAGANAIYANPSTITGSIGVYAGPKLSLAGLYDKVGIGSEIYTRGRNSAMWSMSKPMDDHEFAALDRMVDDTYAQFKQRVADGRGLDDEQVEAVARGRVWSGVDAQEGGLVDELGGFHDAVMRAREEAGIEPDADISLIRLSTRGRGDVVGYPLGATQQPPLAARIVAKVPALHANIPELPDVPALAELERWHAMSDERVLALMPYVFQIQ